MHFLPKLKFDYLLLDIFSCDHISNIYYFPRSIFEKELTTNKRDAEDHFRVTKRLLRSWFDKDAIDSCWDMLSEEIDKILSLDLSSPLLSGDHIEKLGEALCILHACGHTPSTGTTLSSVASTLGLVLGFVNKALSRFALGQIPGIQHSVVHQLSTILIPLQELIQLIENLQSQQVPTLLQLSMYVVRDAIAGHIQQNVENLVAKQAPQWQHLLRNQILLEETKGANALNGLEEALSSVDTLEAHLPKECTSPTNDYDDDYANNYSGAEEYDGYISNRS